MIRTKELSLGFLSLVAAAWGTPSAEAGLLTKWNLITVGDLHASHDVQGPVLVGRDLYVPGQFEAAAVKAAVGGPSLIVGRNVVTGNSNGETVKILQGGTGVIGGKVDGGTTNQNQNGQAIVAPGARVTFDPGVSNLGASSYAELQADSNAFRAMASTGVSVSIPSSSGQPAPATISLSSGSFNLLGNAVVNIDGESLFENDKVQALSLKLNGHVFQDGQSLIINVSGGDLKFTSSGNFIDDFVGAALPHIIWNFYEASVLDLNGRTFRGSILAPNALLMNADTIDGSVFVGAFGKDAATGMRAEVHVPMYNGYDPGGGGVVPEPSSLALATVGMLAGALWSRRKRVS